MTTPPPPPPPVDIDPDEPLVCPDFRAQNRVGRAKPQPPFGKGPKTDGLLVRARTGFDATAEIRARVRYRVAGKRRTAQLGAIAVRVNGERLLRLVAPAKMRRDPSPRAASSLIAFRAIRYFCGDLKFQGLVCALSVVLATLVAIPAASAGPRSPTVELRRQ